MTSAAKPRAAKQFAWDRMLVGGRWVEATGGRTYDIPNPATEEIIGHAPDASREDMRADIDLRIRARERDRGDIAEAMAIVYLVGERIDQREAVRGNVFE